MWLDRLEAAEKRAKAGAKPCFTPEDVRLSQLWVTDPVSEIPPGLVKMKGGQLALGPMDIYLVLDGIFFTKGVEDGDVALAFACYRGIMARAWKLHELEVEEDEAEA